MALKQPGPGRASRLCATCQADRSEPRGVEHPEKSCRKIGRAGVGPRPFRTPYVRSVKTARVPAADLRIYFKFGEQRRLTVFHGQVIHSVRQKRISQRWRAGAALDLLFQMAVQKLTQ